MSRDWLDPFGLRGSRLDPFAFFVDTLSGRGVAADSAERVATALAQQLVGERLAVASSPPVSATVEHIDEVRPPSAMDTVPTSAFDMALWSVLRGRLRDVEYGSISIDRVDLVARDIRLGGAGDRVRVRATEFAARTRCASAMETIANIEDGPQIRLDRGRIEATDPRVARWLWLEITVTARDQQVFVDPVALRILRWEIPVPRRLRRRIVEDAPRLPASVAVSSVTVDGDDLVVEGSVAPVDLPIDVTKLMTDLGAGRTRSILRIAFGV